MSYITLLVVDDRIHVHVADVRVICVIICEGTVVSGEECDWQRVRRQLMQDSLEAVKKHAATGHGRCFTPAIAMPSCLSFSYDRGEVPTRLTKVEVPRPSSRKWD